MTERAVTVLASLGEIAREDWDACANPHAASGGAFDPFVSYDFLSALEDAGCVGAAEGWMTQHLVLDGDDGRPSAVVPCYAKNHSLGEYVFDHGWADAWRRAGGRYYPKLQVSVPFTPATGRRLLTRPGSGEASDRALLASAIVELCRRVGASSAHATFLTLQDAGTFEAAGYLARRDRQFHFENAGYASYDDFLATLASRKRKALKRERREALANGIAIEWVTGRDITEAHLDDFFEFYLDTSGRKWGRPYLNRRFFSLIAGRMAERMLFVFAVRAGRRIAGALNFIGSDALYGRYWGALEDQPFLHFEVCYHQAIDFAIAQRLPRVEAGAQGTHKLARGYMPVETRSAHYIADPSFRRAVADYLDEERRHVALEADALADAGPYRRGDTAAS
ncbi:MAG: GNAT family N-acetyltransferase [Hyphomicrobiales bacterium]